MDASGKEGRTTKLRRSCESCRNLKGKCLTSKDVDRCQRCAREGRQCVFQDTKPRVKRSKNARSRVAEMEQKLNDLYAFVSTTGVSIQDSRDVLTPQANLPEIEPPFHSENHPTYHSAPSVVANRARGPHYPIFELPHLIFDDLQDVISKGVVTFSQAEGALQLFREKSHTFPFIYICPKFTIDHWRRERPFLLLAILTYGAQSNLKLQSTLEKELRTTLSKRVIVDGEKSIDILQGLMVYLGWYQFYFNPERQIVYQLSQMITAMVSDLGINVAPHEETCGSSSFTTTGVGFQPVLSSKDIEVKRTLLGCYFLSSAVCLASRKPNSMKYNGYIEECVQLLAQIGESETDYLLPYFIRLQHLAEDVNQAFDYGAGSSVDIDAVRVEILAQGFREQLTQIESSYPVKIWENTTITTTYHALKVYVNEVGFHAKVPSSLEIMAGQSAGAWYYSPARNESLISCLRACKAYLDYILALSSNDFNNLTFIGYLQLCYVILILGKSTICFDAPFLDGNYFRTMANIPHYLEALVAKTGSLVPLINDIPQFNFMWKFHHMCNRTKTRYNQILNDFEIAGFDGLGLPRMSFIDLMPVVAGPCLLASETGLKVGGWMDLFAEDFPS